MAKFNAASRLHSVLARANKLNPSHQAATLWGKALGFEEPLDDRELNTALGILFEQVAIVRNALRGQGRDMTIHEPTLVAVESALSLRKIGGSWKGVKDALQDGIPERMLTLSDFLDDERTLEKEALKKALAEVERLRTLVDESQLPLEFKAFLLAQVARIDLAIRFYPLQGMAAFHNAAQASGTEFGERVKDVNEHREDEATQAVAGFWKAFDEWTDRVYKVTKVFTLATAVTALTPDAGVGGNPMLPPGHEQILESLAVENILFLPTPKDLPEDEAQP